MHNEKVTFNLQCPTAVRKEEFYLNLIDYLVKELRKYTEVEIYNESILENYKLNSEIKECEIMIQTYQQKLDLLKAKRRLSDKNEEDFE